MLLLDTRCLLQYFTENSILSVRMCTGGFKFPHHTSGSRMLNHDWDHKITHLKLRVHVSTENRPSRWMWKQPLSVNLCTVMLKHHRTSHTQVKIWCFASTFIVIQAEMQQRRSRDASSTREKPKQTSFQSPYYLGLLYIPVNTQTQEAVEKYFEKWYKNKN